MSEFHPYPPLPKPYRERYFAAKLSGYLDIHDLNSPEVWCLGQYLGYWLTNHNANKVSEKCYAARHSIDFDLPINGLRASFDNIQENALLVVRRNVCMEYHDPSLNFYAVRGSLLLPLDIETHFAHAFRIRLTH